MKKTYYQRETELIKAGKKDVRPRSAKIECTPKGKYRVIYKISYIDDNQKVNWNLSGSEAFRTKNQALDYKSLLDNLEMGNHAVLNPLLLNKEGELSITEYLEEYLQEEIADLKVNHGDPNSEKQSTKKDINSRKAWIHSLNCFFEDKRVSKISRLDDSLVRTMPDYFFSTIVRPGNNYRNSHKRTLSRQSVMHRLQYFKKFVNHVEVKYPHIQIKHFKPFSIPRAAKIKSKISVRTDLGMMDDITLLKLCSEMPISILSKVMFMLLGGGCRHGKTSTLLISEVYNISKNRLTPKPVIELLEYEEISYKGKVYESKIKMTDPTPGKVHELPVTNELKKFLQIYKIWLTAIKEKGIISPFMFPVVTGTSAGAPRLHGDMRVLRKHAMTCLDKKDAESLKMKSFRAIYSNRLKDSYSSTQNQLKEQFSDGEVQYLMHHKRGNEVLHNHYLRNTPQFLEHLKNKLEKCPYGFNFKDFKKRLMTYGL